MGSFTLNGITSTRNKTTHGFFPFEFAICRGLSWKGRDLSVHVNDLFVQGVGEVEFPVFLRNERRQKCAAGISSEDKGVGCCWFFYLQQRESGTRWTNENSFLLSSSFQITLEKGKTSKRDDTAVAGSASVESWPLPAAWFFLFLNPARQEMLDREKKIAGWAQAHDFVPI